MAALWVAYTLAAVGLIVLVLRARPITPGNLALVGILAHQAIIVPLSVLIEAAKGPNYPAEFADFNGLVSLTALQIPTLLLWAPLIFLAGPLLLGNAPGRRAARMLAGVGLAPNVVFLLVMLVAPSLVLTEGNDFLGQPADGFVVGIVVNVFVGFALTVAILAREALTTPLAVRRGQFALLAAAFTVEGGFHASNNLAKILEGKDFHNLTPDHWGIVLPALVAVAALLFVGVGAWTARVALRDADADRRKWARILLGFLGAATLTGILASPLTSAEEFRDPSGAFHALWDLAGLALIVYAGMRFQLFSLERRAKQSLTVTAALAIGFIAFETISNVVENMLQNVDVIAGLPANGLVAAAIVGAAGAPIIKVGERVGRKVFPNVAETKDYEHKRKLQIYRAALEGAFADGIATPRESAFLKRLRVELSILDAEHDAMELLVRQELAAAKGAPAGASPTV